MTVRIDQHRAREPDVVVQCGKEFDPDALVADDPVVVAEVISPSSAQIDNVDKLAEYFSLPSVQNYLIVNPSARTVTHHARTADKKILTEIVRFRTGRAGVARDFHFRRCGVRGNPVIGGSSRILSRPRYWPFPRQMVERLRPKTAE